RIEMARSAGEDMARETLCFRGILPLECAHTLLQSVVHIGIEQGRHCSTSCARYLARSTTRPEPRSGDAAKNSVKLPLRLVFRSHTSAETTIAAIRPRRVIVCGPLACAQSINSLNRDFASATVQLSSAMAMPSRRLLNDIIVKLVK